MPEYTLHTNRVPISPELAAVLKKIGDIQSKFESALRKVTIEERGKALEAAHSEIIEIQQNLDLSLVEEISRVGPLLLAEMEDLQEKMRKLGDIVRKIQALCRHNYVEGVCAYCGESESEPGS